jgi:hypothetical protein
MISLPAGHCRRDAIEPQLAQSISGFGTFETCQLHCTMSAFRGNPEDMCSC